MERAYMVVEYVNSAGEWQKFMSRRLHSKEQFASMVLQWCCDKTVFMQVTRADENGAITQVLVEQDHQTLRYSLEVLP